MREERILTELTEMRKQQDKVIAKMVDMETYMRDELATKSELKELEGRVTDHIDGFARLHATLDQEFIAMQSRTGRIEEDVEVLKGQVGTRRPE
jgi:hypothetical protein